MHLLGIACGAGERSAVNWQRAGALRDENGVWWWCRAGVGMSVPPAAMAAGRRRRRAARAYSSRHREYIKYVNILGAIVRALVKAAWSSPPGHSGLHKPVLDESADGKIRRVGLENVKAIVVYCGLSVGVIKDDRVHRLNGFATISRGLY